HAGGHRAEAARSAEGRGGAGLQLRHRRALPLDRGFPARLMPPTPSRRLHLAAGGDAPAPRSPAQQLFASLTGRIDAQRALLAEWAAAIEAYDRRYAQDYLPLHVQYRDLHVELLDFLDVAASGGMRLGRTDLQALHGLIADMAASLLLGEDDPARRDRLDALLDKYASPASQAPEDDDGPDAVLRRVEAE